MQEITNILSTAYDDAYRTILEKCSILMLPVLRELFGEDFTGDEQIILNQNELFIRKADGSAVERITDSSFQVLGRHIARHYHIECQCRPDETILIRLFEYDSQIALDHSVLKGHRLTVEFPRTALIYLRCNADTPDEMTIEVKAPNGQSVTYGVPVLKIQKYSLKELFEKELLFLLPFYGFCYEKQLPEIDRDEGKRKNLVDVYRSIRIRLDELCESKQLNEYQKYELIHTSRLVLGRLMEKYPKTRKEVYDVMGGKVIESEADRILKQGMKQGKYQAIRESIEKMLGSGKMPEQIAEFCGYELSEVMAVQEEMLQRV